MSATQPPDLSRAGDLFEADVREMLRDPESRKRFTLKYSEMSAYAELFAIMEEARERQSLSKAAAARRIGWKPSALSRLLGGRNVNPTLETLSLAALALDLQFEVHVKVAPPLRADGRSRPLLIINDLDD